MKILINLLLLYALTSCAQNNKMDKNIKGDSLVDKFELSKSEEEWKNTLTEEQYYILRQKGTERPFSGKYLNHKEVGTYICSACKNELFESESKFDSHCGWPSFYAEKAKGKIIYKKDSSIGMIRTEIICAKCGGHLGHVFDDGPNPTGLRFCVNSISIEFVPKE